MALELGTAFVTLLPSTRGFGSKLSSQISGELRNAGTAPGMKFGQEFNTSASRGISALPGTISKHSSSAATAADRGGTAAGKRFGSGFGISAKAFLGVAFAGISALVATKVAGLVSGAVEAASQMEQSQGAVTAIFKKNAKEIEKAAAGAAQSLGLSANEYRELASALGAQLKNKGIKDYAGQTKKLIGLGADLSAQFGGSTKDAVDSLNSALRGETDPIEKYGVSLNQTAIGAEAVRLGLSKTAVDTKKLGTAQLGVQLAQRKYNAAVKEHGASSTEAKKAQIGLNNASAALKKTMGGTKVELTGQQKAQAALSLITRQTADAQGAFGRESDTLAGKQARAKASVENLKASIGNVLLPVFSTVVGYINTNVIPAISSFVDGFKKGEGIGGTVRRVFESVGSTLKNLSTTITEQVWPPIRDFFGRMVDAAKGLYDLFVNGDYTSAIRNAFGWEKDQPFVAFLREVRDFAIGVYNVFVDQVLPILRGFAGFLLGTVVPALGSMVGWLVENRVWLGGIATVVGSMWGAWKLYTLGIALWRGVILLAANAARIFTAAQIILNAILSANPIGLVILALVGLVAGLVYAWKTSETFRSVVTAVWEGIKSVVSAVWEWMTSVFDNLKVWFTVTLPAAFEAFKGFFSSLWDGIKSKLSTVWEWIKSVFTGLKNWVTVTLPNAFTTFGSFFSRLWTNIQDIGRRGWGWLKTNVWDKFLGIFGTLKSAFKNFGDTLLRGWKNIIASLWKPLKWAADNIFGKLAGVWNAAVGAFGMNDKKITIEFPPKPPGWAAGGYTGPGSKYQPAGVVHADEYVLRKEATNKLRRTIGLGGLDYMNRTGQMPGYAKGGMVYQQMQSWLRTALPWARVSSSYRPGSITSSGNRSLHSAGKALDLVPSGKGTLMGIFNFLASRFPNAAELIYTPAGRRQIKNGRNMVYGGSVARDHYDHVHFGMHSFPGGGSSGGAIDLLSSLLPPGVGMMMKMANWGYSTLLGRINAASPGTKGFNSPLAKGGEQMATFLNAKVSELEAQQLALGTFGGDHSGTAPGASVERWRSTVLRALSIMGQPSSLANTVLRRMQQESGGNPRAVNNWDSNAKRGTPSKGLMQTIDPTYRAYAHPSYNKGVFDPLSNILASMRYAMRRYGSLSAAYNRGGGYAAGGLVTPELFDSGGILSPGLTLVSNQTGKPETVRTYAQESDLQSYLASDRTNITINGVKYDSAGEVARELDFAMARTALRRR